MEDSRFSSLMKTPLFRQTGKGKYGKSDAAIKNGDNRFTVDERFKGMLTEGYSKLYSHLTYL